MKPFWLIFLLGIFTLCDILGQINSVDSLEQLLESSESDSVRLHIMNELAQQWLNTDPVQAKTIIVQAIQLGQEVNDNRGLANAHFILSKIYINNGQNDSAIIHLQACLPLAAHMVDSIIYLNAKLEESIILSQQSKDTRATEELYHILAVAERKEYGDKIVNAYRQLGRLQMGLGNTEKSIDYLELALQKAEEIGNNQLMAMLCANLAVAHESVDVIRRYAKRAIGIAKENNYKMELTLAYNALGIMHLYYTDQIDSSIYYKKLALKQASNNENERLKYMLIGSIADAYSYSDLDSAAYYYNRILNEFNIQTYSHARDRNLRKYSYVKSNLGQWEEAFEMLDSSYTLAEQRYRTNMENQVADANAKYETERKEAELAKQGLVIEQQKNTRNLILLLGSLILGVIAFLSQYYINKQKRDKREAQLALELEQQRARDLIELNQTKDNLFNNVSHELRTPLTMIIGPLQQAATTVKNVGIKKEIDLALNNSKRLLTLVNEILDLSKLDAEKLSIEYQSIHLNNFLKRIFHSFSSLAATRKILLKDNFEGFEQTYFVETDPQKLETILNNLISNAIKFSSSGDTVYLNLDKEALKKNQLMIAVQDEGMGISEEARGKVFDRYYQAPNHGHSAGTGIGLALTKELTELLGGQIAVVSQVGQGSTFSICIPIQVKTGVDSDTLTNAPNLDEGSGAQIKDSRFSFSDKPSILIVEDDVSMSSYLSGLLEPQYHVQKAYNGKEALEKLKKESFDLISSDVMMPEMDGFTFREQINQDPRIKETPFIMLTARGLEEDKLKGFQLGIDDYLTKPFSPDELKARIYNLIRNKKSREETLQEGINPDEMLVHQAIQYIRSHIHDEGIKVSDLSTHLNYSARQLGRILKRTVGLSPVEFILEIRLQQAYDLLKNRSFGTINEVRYACGMSSPSYFTTKFKERFGINPSEMIRLN